MKKRIIFSFVMSLFLIFISFGCSKSISDETVTSQVVDYLRNDTRPGFMSDVSFSKWFKIENIAVKDKLIKDKECIVMCNISVKIKDKYAGNSGVTAGYGFIVGHGQGVVGNVRTTDVKFLFEKYEKGWKIKSDIK